MKKLYVLLGSLLCGTLGFAQLSIQDTSGTTLVNGDTVKVSGLSGFQLSDKFYVYNGSSVSISTDTHVFPTKQYASKCSYSICVGTNCYATVGDSNSFQCPKAFSVSPGRYANMLFTDYNPSAPGITTLLLVVYDKNSPADSSWIFVQFNATPTGIANISNNDFHVSQLYPNPATSKFSFTYYTNYEAHLYIYNSLGQLAKNMELQPGKENTTVNVTDIPSGIYICKIISAGAKPVFRRLIISH